MTKIKEKTLKKLKKKRFMPSIILFVTFAFVGVGVIAVGIELLAAYSVGAKMSILYDQVVKTGVAMERCLREDKDITYAGYYASHSRDNSDGICVVRPDGHAVVQTGKSEPILDQTYEVDLGERYRLYPDREWVELYGDPAEMLKMSVFEILRRAFADTPGKEGAMRARWMGETILEERFWIQVPMKSDKYKVYAQCVLTIERQDVVYAFAFGIVMLIVLLVPLIFLFINTILNIGMQRRLTKILYMDAVTGGHNWIYFQGMGQKLLGRYWNAHKAYAMVDLHLVHYASYLTCYGSKQGEELMECMDGFLKTRIQSRELFGHYGGADFGLLIRCEGANADEWKDACYRRLRSLLAELTGLQPERKLHFHAGVCMIPPVTNRMNLRSRRRNIDINQMFNYANNAQQARHSDVDQIFFFDKALLEEQSWEQWVESHMQAALSAGEFQVYLQPKYEPVSAKLVGAEALVRWNCPEKGLIPPSKFIPIFETNGFIMKLDDYMISQIAKLQAEWTVQGKKTVPISVNVSRVHFAKDGLAEHIGRLVDAYGPKHELVELEVTESAFFDDKEVLINTVKQLRAYGFPISMDDFGAGYSSLNSLKDIPLDVLKLDAEFFRGEDAMTRGRVIVKETIYLARELSMRVVAEGIEQRDQVDFLAGLGCDMIQGYYFAKPMPIEEFAARVAADA